MRKLSGLKISLGVDIRDFGTRGKDIGLSLVAEVQKKAPPQVFGSFTT
jgi:hypothetical protein